MGTPWERPPYAYDDQLRRVETTVKFRAEHPDARTPEAKFSGDAGYDLYTVGNTLLPPGEIVDVPTGLHLELPPGYWLRLVGRSSTFRRRRLLVIEGVIDNGYRGGLFFGVWNTTGEPVTIGGGERLAQAILSPICHFPWVEVDLLNDSDRGEQGFGSTGS